MDPWKYLRLRLKQDLIGDKSTKGKGVIKMKSRRVVITVELKSSSPLKDLKESVKNYLNNRNDGTEVLQVQANVIKENK